MNRRDPKAGGRRFGRRPKPAFRVDGAFGFPPFAGNGGKSANQSKPSENRERQIPSPFMGLQG